jgi:hypothetical protein
MVNSGELEFTLGVDVPELLGKLETEETKPQAAKPKARSPKPEADTLARDSTPGPDSSAKTVSPPRGEFDPLGSLRRGLAGLSRAVEPLDFTYAISRTSELVGVYDPPPWTYRLGFTDIFTFDSTHLPSNATRERRNTLRLSTGGRVRELGARIAYEWSQGKDLSSIFRSTTLDRSITWPDLELTQGKVHNLLKKWATDSKLTFSYRRRHDLGGEYVRFYEQGAGDSTERESLGMYGRRESYTNELSPLVSWTTTWKKRVTTTLSANYSFGAATDFLSDSGTERSVTHSEERGMDLSLSYAFSAPQGLRLPFLRRFRFTSDLSLKWSLRASQTRRWLQRWAGGVPADTTNDLQRDRSFGTTVAASYRFSRSIEAGLTTGYSQSRGLSPTTTETMDLDFWVLFRF